MTKWHGKPRDTGTFILRCRECGAAISRPLRETSSEAKFSDKDQQQVVPAGFFARAEQVVISGKKPYARYQGEVLVGIPDLPFVLKGGDRNGCCGPMGGGGFNLFCPDDHPVGTEFGDCWMPHCVQIPLSLVELCPV